MKKLKNEYLNILAFGYIILEEMSSSYISFEYIKEKFERYIHPVKNLKSDTKLIQHFHNKFNTSMFNKEILDNISNVNLLVVAFNIKETFKGGNASNFFKLFSNVIDLKLVSSDTIWKFGVHPWIYTQIKKDKNNKQFCAVFSKFEEKNKLNIL